MTTEAAQKIIATLNDDRLTEMNQHCSPYRLGMVHQILTPGEYAGDESFQMASQIAANIRRATAPKTVFTRVNRCLLLEEPAFIAFLMGLKTVQSPIYRAFFQHPFAELQLLPLIRKFAFDEAALQCPEVQIQLSLRRKKQDIQVLKSNLKRMQRDYLEEERALKRARHITHDEDDDSEEEPEPIDFDSEASEVTEESDAFL